MHRPYTREKFTELVERIREARPGIAVTTDVIVGFPGETESDYLETRDMFERLAFDNAFVFRYSKRRGTPAAEMKAEIQVPERIKEERNLQIGTLARHVPPTRVQRSIGVPLQLPCR